jgi:hypothetical protein
VLPTSPAPRRLRTEAIPTRANIAPPRSTDVGLNDIQEQFLKPVQLESLADTGDWMKKKLDPEYPAFEDAGPH